MAYVRDRVNYVRTLKCALVLSLAVGFSSCKKNTATEEPSEESPVAAATPTPKPATPPPPAVAVATPPPVATPAPTPEFAPPGVYFLVTAVSVETSDGIIGLKPGQRLQQVRPGVYRADGNEVTLSSAQVTNDLAVARQLAAQEQNKQAAIQQRLAAPSTPSAAPTVPGAPAANTPMTPPPTKAAQDREAKLAARKAIIQQINTLSQQLASLATSLNAVSKHATNWAAASRNSPQAYSLLQQYNAVLKQKGDLESQLSQYQ